MYRPYRHGLYISVCKGFTAGRDKHIKYRGHFLDGETILYDTRH